MNRRDLAQHLDFANHHADATTSDIMALCAAVLKHGFHSAFVNQHYVPLAKRLLRSRASAGTVISFPLGQDTAAAKVYAAANAARSGADELDVSMNVGLFKERKYALVLREMKQVVRAAKRIKPRILVKFIIETGYLTDAEIMKAARLVVAADADFVKTCSGYGPRGASLNDVRLIKQAIGNKAKIKVAGGISTTEEALAFIKAGAHRIGTSHAPQIVKGAAGSGRSAASKE